MAKLGAKFATLFQLLDERFGFGPKRFWGGQCSSSKACTSPSTLMIFDVDYLFPYLKISGLFALKRIFLKERNDDVIEVGYPSDSIFHDGITVSSRIIGIIAPKCSHSQYFSNPFEDRFIIGPQTEFEGRVKLAMTILVDHNDGPKMSFAVGKASHPIAEPIGYFQIKAQSFLHRNLPKLKPTSPQFLLPGQEVGGKRADGLHNQKTARLLTIPMIAQNRSIVNG